MTETEFLAMVDAILDKIEAQSDDWFENFDIDIDAVRNGHVLTLVFENNQQVVINSQAPLQEIWLASPKGAFHYQLKKGVWTDTRGELSLAEQIAKQCSSLAGKTLSLSLSLSLSL